MKKITTLFIALLITISLSAQMIKFQKTYGGTGTDRCWAIAQTSDGGYILAGETNSFGAGNYDGYLTKTDANGVVQWTHTYGGANYDWIYAVRQTSDGGFIAVGGTESAGSGLGDMWIFKTNSSGVVSWQRTCGSSGGDSGADIIQTSDGGYAAAGFQNGGASTNDNACLVKMDGSGNVQWIHSYSVGSDDEYGNAVAQTQDGGYIIGAETDNSSSGSVTALVIKTDASGTVQWANTYGGSNDSWISAIKVLPSGDYAVAGVSSQVSLIDIWLARLNPNGTPVWSNSYAGPGAASDNCIWFTSTADGGYALCGRTNSFSVDYEAFLMKTDSTGGPEWSKRFGGTGNDRANMVVQSSNGGYAIAATSQSFSATEKVYLIKTDTTGVSGCNENIPSFLMSPMTTTSSAVTITDASLTNAAASSLTSSSPTITETSLCFTVGENEVAVDENLIAVYPNPAREELKIKNAELKIENVEVYSSVGEKLFSQKLKANSQQQQISINVSSLTSGVYFVRIKTEEGLTVKRFVKN